MVAGLARGIVALPEGARGGTLRITVEETSRADAPATVVARLAVTPPGEGPAAFAVPLPDGLPPGDYTVRAHLDMSGDGRVAAGDLVSTASHRAAQDMVITVEPV